MSNGSWTDNENDLIVADYFAMLVEDMAGRPYNKAKPAQLRRFTEPNGRLDRVQASEYQRCAEGAREDWIPGYKPAFNFQMTLVDASARWLAWIRLGLGSWQAKPCARGCKI